MDESTAIAKVYSLPEHGFVKHRRGLVLQVVFLGIFAIASAIALYYAFPGSVFMRGLAALLGGSGFLFLLFGLPFLPGAQRRLWRQVKVGVGDHYIIVRHKGAPVDVRILPQQDIRVEREQVTAIRETSYGLVIATHYDPQALIIPVQLDDADYQEIAATLSTWCTIQPRPSSAVSGIQVRLMDRVKLAQRSPLFYDRGKGVFAAAVLVGCIAGVVPGVFVIIEWSKGRQVPASLALVIVSLYVINILGTTIGSCIAFGWLDYGLARIGLRRPTRSAVWVGIVAAVMTGAFSISTGLSLLVGLIIVIAGTLLSAGLAWLLSLPQVGIEPAPESCAATEQELASHAAIADSEPGSPILGAYRLTFDEFYMAVGYSTMMQPRFLGKPRLISAFLPRSVDRGSVESTFSSHPHRNRIMRFSVNGDSITWTTEAHTEGSVGWEQVKKVARTPKGFLLYWTRRDFDWVPFQAFFTEDGPKTFAELAQRHTEYSEIAQKPRQPLLP